MNVEPNDIISQASNTNVSSSGKRSTILSGKINPEGETDIYQFQATLGEGITLDIDSIELGFDLDSFLRLYDADGNELAVNDDHPAPGETSSFDSYLTYVADDSSPYYVEVSSLASFAASTGEYNLEIGLVEVVSTKDPDDTIKEAISTNLNDLGQSLAFNDVLDTNTDVDIYRLQLDVGDGVIFDINTESLNSDLDSQLRLFDAEGNELATNNDDFTQSESFSVDSLISYIAETKGSYYLGVSSSGNSAYDPLVGRTNFTPDLGNSSGSYELNIDLVEVEPDDDPDNTIAEAIDSKVNASGQDFAVVKDSLDFQADNDIGVDVYGFELEQGDTVTLNVNAAQLETGLDPALRLFDAEGKELAISDDYAAPGEDPSIIDSYIEFTADTTGQYFIGVSGVPNTDYDVVEGTNNLDLSDYTSSAGDYQLIINSFDNIKGTNKKDILQGNSTNNTLIQGLKGNDTITGSENNDYFVGGAGKDVLRGKRGNDTLIGGGNNDSLYGDIGRDVLQGDGGTNKLWGGKNQDIFVVEETKKTADVILDFEAGIDKILLTNGSSFLDITLENFSDGIGVAIFAPDGNEIVQIPNVNFSDISEDDFIIKAID